MNININVSHSHPILLFDHYFTFYFFCTLTRRLLQYSATFHVYTTIQQLAVLWLNGGKTSEEINMEACGSDRINQSAQKYALYVFLLVGECNGCNEVHECKKMSRKKLNICYRLWCMCTIAAQKNINDIQ